MNHSTQNSISNSDHTGLKVVQSLEIVIGFFGLCGNLVSIIILKRRSAKNHTNFLIINQSLADFITSALLIVLTLNSLLDARAPSTPTLGYIYCVLWDSKVLLWSFFAISTFNLTVISVERYLAVIHPFWYIANFKRSTTFVLAALCWMFGPVFNVAYNILTLEYQDGQCFKKPRSTLVQVLSVLLFFWEYFFPACMMSFSFVAVSRKFLQMNRVAVEWNATSTSIGTGLPEVSLATRPSGSTYTERNTQCSPPQEVNVRNEASGSRIPKTKVNLREGGSNGEASRYEPNEPGGQRNAMTVRRLNTTKVLLVVYLAYVICWSPNHWYFLQFNLGGTIDFEGIFYYITIIMGICNSCVNPVIYVMTMSSFKKGFRSIFKIGQID